MALTDYKKVVNITERDSLSGELTYKLIYTNQKSYDYNTYKEIHNSIPIVKRIPTAGDKMYFLNDVVIPRFKIKSFCEKTGARVVKYLNSANYVILGKKTIEKHFIHEYYHEYDRNDFIDFIDGLIGNMRSLAPQWMTDLKQLVVDSDENVLVSSVHSLRHWFDTHTPLSKENSGTYTHISYESYDRLTDIMNLTCDIVEEDTILKELNKGTEMNKEIFENIQKLFESVDDENVKIAMELMSNCDFDKSAPYLLLLLRKYYEKIQDSSTKHHVNFKGLLNYFDFTPSSFKLLDLEDILGILKDKKLLVKSTVDMFIPQLVEEIVVDSKLYRVSNVVFIDDDGKDIEIIDDTIVAEVPEVPEIDAIIYSELSEVAVSIKDPTLYIKIMNVRDLVDSPEALLPIIKYLDENYQYELATLLTQSYLSLPHEI